MQVETVKIKADNDQGFIIINKSDFDNSKHELFTVKKTQRKTQQK